MKVLHASLPGEASSHVTRLNSWWGGAIIVAIFKNTIIPTQRLSSADDVRVLVEKFWLVDFSHLMQLSGSWSQSVLHMNLSQCNQPMVGVRARPLSRASAAGPIKKTRANTEMYIFAPKRVAFTHLVTMVKSIQLFGSISWFPGTAPSRWVTSIWTNGFKMRFWPTNGVPLGSLRFKRRSAKQEHY